MSARAWRTYLRTDTQSLRLGLSSFPSSHARPSLAARFPPHAHPSAESTRLNTALRCAVSRRSAETPEALESGPKGWWPTAQRRVSSSTGEPGRKGNRGRVVVGGRGGRGGGGEAEGEGKEGERRKGGGAHQRRRRGGASGGRGRRGRTPALRARARGRREVRKRHRRRRERRGGEVVESVARPRCRASGASAGPTPCGAPRRRGAPAPPPPTSEAQPPCPATLRVGWGCLRGAGGVTARQLADT